MKTAATKKSKYNTADGYAYLTKRILISATNRGIRKAAKETMNVMGYNVIALNGWIVKKYADGQIEQISLISPASIKAE